MPQQHNVYAGRGAAPLWLVLAVVVPLGLAFLTSLVLAVALAGAGAALAAIFLPLLGKSSEPADQRTIELDPSEYKNLDSASREERK